MSMFIPCLRSLVLDVLHGIEHKSHGELHAEIGLNYRGLIEVRGTDSSAVGSGSGNNNSSGKKLSPTYLLCLIDVIAERSIVYPFEKHTAQNDPCSLPLTSLSYSLIAM